MHDISWCQTCRLQHHSAVQSQIGALTLDGLHHSKVCRCVILLQVLHLLAEDRAQSDPELNKDRLGYSTLQMAILAACVGSYLFDLLHMRRFRFSPMSVSDPDGFLKACQGE